MSDTLVEKAREAIEEVFSDTSQSKQETREDLDGLAGELEILIASIDADIEQEGEEE